MPSLKSTARLILEEEIAKAAAASGSSTGGAAASVDSLSDTMKKKVVNTMVDKWVTTQTSDFDVVGKFAFHF